MDELDEVIDGCKTMREDNGGTMPPHGIVDLGGGKDFAFVPLDNREINMGLLLWALGAMCKRRGAPRCFVAFEFTGRVFKDEGMAKSFTEKYGGDLKNVPRDDRDNFFAISEITFDNPEGARIAHVPIRLGNPVTYKLPEIMPGHICRVFHPVMKGWDSGFMPPGVELVEGTGGEVPDDDGPPEPWDN